MPIKFLRIAATYLLAVSVGAMASMAVAEDWPAFRGDGSGSVDRGPSQLNMSDQGNLAWRTAMPGRSVAGPIVVDGRVITTSSAGPDGAKMFVTALDLQSGKAVWQQSFDATGRPFSHPTSANAAPTPASDGSRVVALFSSNDLVCLSVSGELLWYRGLGYENPKAGNDIGMASSPIIAGDVVVVQIESKGESFAAGIDLESGADRWRIDRPRDSNWSSPLLVSRGDGSQEVILQSGEGVTAVDPGTGHTKWTIDEGRSSIPSPTISAGLLMLPGDELLVLDVQSSGAKPREAWRSGQLNPPNASVVANQGRVYALKGSVLVSGDLSDGQRRWQERLGSIGSGWATPAVAADLIYAFDQSGNGVIVKDEGETAKVISEVSLGEVVFGSPAIADGRLVLRAVESVYCFE